MRGGGDCYFVSQPSIFIYTPSMGRARSDLAICPHQGQPGHPRLICSPAPHLPESRDID